MSTTIRRMATAAVLAALVPGLAACSLKDDEPDLVAGKRMFVQKCGSCHILDRAGTRGTSGPDLDQALQQAKKENFGESAIRGMVYAQIRWPARFQDNERPDGSPAMPADLVDEEGAHDVAAYVARSVARRGEDTGILATAVKKPGSGRPIAARGGKLTIPSDPGGQLAYTSTRATAPPGPITIESPNDSGVPHNIVIDDLGEGEVVENGVSSFEAELAAGETYEYYCSVPGHREGGMKGTLTVRG